MAKTYQNLIDEARQLVQDTDSDGYRYETDTLRNKLNRGLQELGRIRPEAFYSTFVTTDIVVPEIGSGNLNDVVAMPMMFYSALVYWVAGSAELVEDEYTNDSRAAALLSQFKQMVIGL